jgi:hypothetical protein
MLRRFFMKLFTKILTVAGVIGALIPGITLADVPGYAGGGGSLCLSYTSTF